MTGPLTEKTSARYTGQLVDDAGLPVSSAVLTSFTLTLYDKNTGTIINGRNAQSVLNVNNVTIDTSGNIVWKMQALDNAIITDTVSMETHIALFIAIWPTGECRHEVSIPVKNINKVT